MQVVGGSYLCSFPFFWSEDVVYFKSLVGCKLVLVERLLFILMLTVGSNAFAQQGEIMFVSKNEFIDFSEFPAKLDSFSTIPIQDKSGIVVETKSICSCDGIPQIIISDGASGLFGPAPKFYPAERAGLFIGRKSNFVTFQELAGDYLLVSDFGARAFERLTIESDTVRSVFDSVWIHNGYSYNLSLCKHRNDDKFWVATRPFGKDIQLYQLSSSTYKLERTTVGLTGNTGSIFPNSDRTFEDIKFSHQGNHLACVADTLRYNVYLYDFNDSTGVLSNPRPVRKSSNRGYPNVSTMAVEFSPSGRFLYCFTYYADYSGNLRAYEIEQFDLNFQNIDQSRVLLAWVDHRNQKYNSFEGIWGSCLGQDNRIYVTPFSGNHISTINYPDRKGTSCNLEIYAYTTNLKVARIIGIPPGASRAPHIFRDPDAEACTDTFRFRISNAEQYRDLTIYWGDGDSLAFDSTQDISRDFTHIYEYTGTYGLSVKGRTKTCNAYLSSVDTFNILKKPKLFSGAVSTNSLCGSATVTISDTVQKTQYFQIAWGDGAVKDTFLNPDSTHTIQWSHSYSQDSNYAVKKALRGRILDLQYCEMNESDTIEVHLLPQATLQWRLLDQANSGPDNVAEYCQNQFSRIAIGSDSTLDYSLFWGDGTDSSGEIIGGQLITVAHQYSDSGTFKIKIVGQNDHGCSDTVSAEVRVLHVIKAEFEIEDQSVCHRDTLRVHFPEPDRYDSAYWLFDGSRYSTEITQVVPAWGGVTYNVTYFTRSNEFCWDTASQVVDVQETPDLYLGSVLVNPCENTASFEATLTHTGYQGIMSINSDSFSFSSDTSVVLQLVDQINEIYVAVRNQNGCSEIYRDTVELIPVEPVAILPDTPVVRCFNEQGLMMFTHDASHDNAAYWTLGVDFYQGDTFTFVSMLDTGHHALLLVYIDSNSCPAYDSLDLSIRPSPIARWSYVDSPYRLNDVLVIDHLSDSMGIPISSVQWNFDQEQYDGQSWSISLTESGIHQLQMIVSLINGCSDTLDASVQVSDQFGSSDILLYPNPTAGICILDMKRKFAGLQCVVYDDVGKKIIGFDIQGRRSSIDLSNHRSGVYRVVIRSATVVLEQFSVIRH